MSSGSVELLLKKLSDNLVIVSNLSNEYDKTFNNKREIGQSLKSFL